MSKTSEAKTAQGYIQKVIPQTCSNCENFTFEMKLPRWMVDDNEKQISNGTHARYDDSSKEQANLSCGIGGFAVKRMGKCKIWQSSASE